MGEPRGYVEFVDGSRLYAKPRERPCICIEGVQQCAYHAQHGRHSDEAAEERGVWLRWHNGSDVGSTPGFRRGGKATGA